jgi:hypothetical protein
MLASCEYLSFIFVLWPMEFWRQNLQNLPLQGTGEFFNLKWALVLVRTQLPFPVTEDCCNCHMTCTSSWACWLITTNTGYKIMQHTFVGEYAVEWNIRLLGSKCADRPRNMNQRNATWVYFLLSHSISMDTPKEAERCMSCDIGFCQMDTNSTWFYCFSSQNISLFSLPLLIHLSPVTLYTSLLWSISQGLCTSAFKQSCLQTDEHQMRQQEISCCTCGQECVHPHPHTHTRNLEAQLHSILNASKPQIIYFINLYSLLKEWHMQRI